MVRVNGSDPDTGSAACADITSIVVRGNGGSDTLDLRRVRPKAFPAVTSVSIDGGEGENRIYGSRLTDSIMGGVDSDSIHVDLRAPDIVDGGDATDFLLARVSSETRISDTRLTSDGVAVALTSIEWLSARATREADVIDGRRFSGTLNVSGGQGDDRVLGGTGQNNLIGRGGDDVLVGGPRHDDLATGNGDDLAIGNAGGDSFYDDPGVDVHRGQEGADLFLRLEGHDNVFVGGPGHDLFGILTSNSVTLFDRRVETANDSALLRSIELGSLLGSEDARAALHLDASAFSGDVEIRGGFGDDVLLGGTANDSLVGLEGDDRMFGGAGRDVLEGGEGSDTCDGGPGADDISQCERS
jgi:Ca2+-binding RTX toxin-like protein